MSDTRIRTLKKERNDPPLVVIHMDFGKEAELPGLGPEPAVPGPHKDRRAAEVD